MGERRDVSLRGIAAGVLIVLASIAASLVFAAGMVALTGTRAPGPNGAVPPRIQGATLQTAPHGTLEQFLRKKRERLESSGPGHISIDEAMRRLAARGHHR